MAEDRFVEHLQRLMDAGTGYMLTIEGPEEEVVQVVDEGASSTLTVQIGYYPTSHPPTESLAGAGVGVPESWSLTEWEADTFANFAAPRGGTQDIAAFLRQVFEKFYHLGSEIELSFTLERI